jgi:hypothetical protein
MQIAALILANILFLAIVCLGVIIERRVSALELSRRDMAQAAPEEENPAEKRFTQGIANILGYAADTLEKGDER